MMNRQVRGSEKLEWEDFGSVCINHAAETYAARHDDEFADGNTMRVQVRQEQSSKSKADQVDHCYQLANQTIELLFDIRCHQAGRTVFGGSKGRQPDLCKLRFEKADRIAALRQQLTLTSEEYRKAYNAVGDVWEKCLGRKDRFQPPGETRGHYASHFFLITIARHFTREWCELYELHLRQIPEGFEAIRECDIAIDLHNANFPFNAEQEAAFRDRLSFERSELDHYLNKEASPVTELVQQLAALLGKTDTNEVTPAAINDACSLEERYQALSDEEDTENTIDPICNLLVERRTEYKVVNPRQGA